jgi:hypothetical protein
MLIAFHDRDLDQPANKKAAAVEAAEVVLDVRSLGPSGLRELEDVVRKLSTDVEGLLFVVPAADRAGETQPARRRL